MTAEIYEWMEEYGASAMKEDFEEKMESLREVWYPITTKLYEGGDQGGDRYGDTGSHDEL